MLIHLEDVGGVPLVELRPSVLAHTNAAEMARELNAHAKAGTMILNLERLNAVDAAGLGTLLRWFRDARRDGRTICVYGLTGQVRALFEVLSLQETVTVCDSREEALLCINGPEALALRATA
jgi:anti-anti-sigma factor